MYDLIFQYCPCAFLKLVKDKRTLIECTIKATERILKTPCLNIPLHLQLVQFFVHNIFITYFLRTMFSVETFEWPHLRLAHSNVPTLNIGQICVYIYKKYILCYLCACTMIFCGIDKQRQCTNLLHQTNKNKQTQLCVDYNL